MLTLVKENNISHIISGHTHMLKITNYFNCISSNSGTVNKKFVEPNKQATYIVAEIDGKDISLRPYII
jgi:predicted phosphodiesterase